MQKLLNIQVNYADKQEAAPQASSEEAKALLAKENVTQAEIDALKAKNYKLKIH